ncbi:MULTISPECIES: YlmC/YmxH family sporulation protein [Bacillus]|uniref:YlmC/YmxH family sporulation protein n=1 Tax=Bacillus TaxID=1386 RepID=UPI0002FB48B7|nr:MULTISPECIES: YlmC/YmxH family sporulation protein [Bacillus]
MERISEFQLKDIINLSDGKKLGTLQDLDIDLVTGQINAIIVTPNGKWMTFFQREEEIIIPWRKIKKIGKDIIFVEYVTLTTINGEKEEL